MFIGNGHYETALEDVYGIFYEEYFWYLGFEIREFGVVIPYRKRLIGNP